MAVPVFPCSRDVDLLSWANHFASQIASSPGAVGLTAAQAADFAALRAAFADAYALAVNPNTNSKANVNAKNQARAQLLNAPGGAKQLTAIVQAFPGVTNTMRGELGLRILDSDRTDVAAPSQPPRLSIVATVGRVSTMRLRDRSAPERRGKPAGAEGATVLYAIGETAPANLSRWYFAMNTARPVFDFTMPSDVPAGSRVWITAFWFNARKEASPAAQPVSVRVNEGLALAA